ncbi:MAG TPA: hypothetical protein VNV38_06030 [Stellaceae bacterium]|jgi:hypothetical protein|nr:hypothetical protein [Stellaceae bacterium]
MTAPALIALLIGAGFAQPQAQAIVNYAEIESGQQLDYCARSWMGEGLFGLTQRLRRDLHQEAGTDGCVSPNVQVQFIARVWPYYYPECAVRFAAGDLKLFDRCFGRRPHTG